MTNVVKKNLRNVELALTGSTVTLSIDLKKEMEKTSPSPPVKQVETKKYQRIGKNIYRAVTV